MLVDILINRKPTLWKGTVLWMNEKRKKDLHELERTIGYRFKNIELLNTAMTHSSFGNGQEINFQHNERMEFLGDSILSVIISLHLFKNITDMTEGQLTRARANIVCEQSLAAIAGSIGLGTYIYMSKGEENTGGRERSSILADSMEALIASIYLDGGFLKSEEFVLSIMKDIIESSIDNKIFNDYKSFFQEYVQKHNLGPIRYLLTSETGPDHLKKFTMALLMDGKVVGTGKGNSKKDAQQSAAKNAINNMGLLDE